MVFKSSLPVGVSSSTITSFFVFFFLPEAEGAQDLRIRHHGEPLSSPDYTSTWRKPLVDYAVDNERIRHGI